MKVTLFAFLAGIFAAAPKAKANSAPVRKIATKSSYTMEQKRELEYLCAKLFEQKDLIAAGRLQLIGLDKIKRRMGKSWPGLQKVVYEVADEVISSYLGKGDIFVRYQDDSYVIIFAEAAPEEAEGKATLIADEIREKLFETGHVELQDIEITRKISAVPSLAMKGKPITDVIEMCTDGSSFRAPKVKPVPPPDIVRHEVLPEDSPLIPAYTGGEEAPVSGHPCSYVPLWDVRNGALSSYLCQPLPFKEEISSLARDISVFQAVANELNRMETENRRLLVLCPVHHSTLHRAETFNQYRMHCQRISEEQRKLLVFLVVGMPAEIYTKNAFWFLSGLKKFAHAVFVEVPLNSKMDFNFIRNAGFDALGISIDNKGMTESEIFALMGTFRQRIRAAIIPKTFALNVSTFSLATSAACMGFNYLGGEAIHGPVAAPDNAYKFQYSDLFEGLKSSV